MSRQRQDPIPPSDPVLPRPFVPLALAFMGGILYAHSFPVSIPLLLAAFLFLSFAACKRVGTFISPIVLTGILAALLGALRMETSLLHQQSLLYQVQELCANSPYLLHGTVEEIRPGYAENITLNLGEVTIQNRGIDTRFPGKITLSLPSQSLVSMQIGDRILAQVRLKPWQGPRVPLSFNWEENQYAQGIVAEAEWDLYTPLLVSPTRWSPLRGLAYEALAAVRARLPIPANQDETTGLLAAMGLGIRAALPPEVKTALSQSGLAHITSISGLHVTLILVLLAFGLKKAGLTRKQATLLTTFGSVFYILLAGPCIPILRAVIMAYVVLGEAFVQRRFSSLNSLALAAILLLALSPRELFLPSFQLSFSAVLVLILFHPWDRWLAHKIPFQALSWLPRSLMTSTLVVIGLAPFTISVFHYWSWGAIFGNLAAIPLVTVLLPLFYLWLVLLPFPFLSEWLGLLVNLLTLSLWNVIDYFGTQPEFIISLPSPGPLLSCLGFAGFLFLCQPMQPLWLGKRYSFRSHHLTLLLFLLGLSMQGLPPWFSPYRIDFPALGQGDCTLIRTPAGHVILIDGGPPPKDIPPGSAPLLVNYLKSLGIRRIDLLVLTHPQADHIGCFKEIAEEFPVALFCEGAPDMRNIPYQALRQTLEAKKIPIRSLLAGDCIPLDDSLLFRVLHPHTHTLTPDQDPNELSVVLLGCLSRFRFLLTGDIGAKEEERLRQESPSMPVDLLKVPHHGSRNSSSGLFVSATRPRAAVILVGINPYSQPHPEIITRYRQTGSAVWRTDQDGTLQLLLRPQGWSLYASRSNTLHRFPTP